jgi:hypothetical protein
MLENIELKNRLTEEEEEKHSLIPKDEFELRHLEEIE